MYAIDQKKCTFCAGCSSVCPSMAIVIYDDRSVITESCIDCGKCKQFCPVGAPGTAGGRAVNNGL